MLAVCKRLNPNVEVPEAGDLVQHISEMVESDDTEKTITINENELTKVNSRLSMRLNTTKQRRDNSL